MKYMLNGKKFEISYQELKHLYLEFTEMDDKTFLDNLQRAAHLACIICTLKETRNEHSISDVGIVHELIHLMGPQTKETPLKEIRELFKAVLKLA